MKKIFMILCSVLLCVSMCSCTLITQTEDTRTPFYTSPSRPTEDVEDDTKEPSSNSITGRFDSVLAENAAAMSALPEGDFDGMSFIITCTRINNMFGVNEGTTELSRAKYARMKTLSEKYNTEIIQAQSDLGGMTKGLSESQSSGMVYTHLLSVSAFYIGTLSYKGLIGSINSLPYVDTQRPYYDREFCESMKTPTGLYALYGDACRGELYYNAVFYNETLTKKAGIDGIETLVAEGGWTLDVFSEYIKRTQPTDSERAAGSFGFICDDIEWAVESMYVSCGMNSASLDGNALKVNDNAQRGDELISRLKTLFGLVDYDYEDIDLVPEYVFTEGKAAFYISTLSSAMYLSGLSDVWGILPMPSLYEGEGYASALSRSSAVICYPAGSVHTNEIGMMTEALFASSYRILDALLFDELLHKHVRKEAALDMIDIILDRARCDMILLYADEYANFRAGTKDAFMQSFYDDVLYSERFYEKRAAADRSLTYVK